MTNPAPLQQEIQVRFRYGVYFTTAVFAGHNPLLKDLICAGGPDLPKKLLVVVDGGVSQHHPRLLAQIAAYCRGFQAALSLAGPPLVVEGGEACKNDPQGVRSLHRAMDAAGLCRHSYVVAVGGGALLDLAGYASATAHRGLRLIRVPTTVMAQADAAVGVKNSINAFGKKNFIGTFAPPVAVINDFTFLITLFQRDWVSGLAEAVKVALIKDPAFFAFLEKHARDLAARRPEPMRQAIYRCADLHLQHIGGGGDPFEFGSSRPLDFGHWAAHKLEQLTGFNLRHGEAVALGLALDTTYSMLAGLLSQGDWERILHTLENLGLALYVPELEGTPILQGLEEFRAHLGGRLTIPLLWAIGHSLEVHDLDHGLIRASAALLRERALGETGRSRPAVMG